MYINYSNRSIIFIIQSESRVATLWLPTVTSQNESKENKRESKNECYEIIINIQQSQTKKKKKYK